MEIMMKTRFLNSAVSGSIWLGAIGMAILSSSYAQADNLPAWANVDTNLKIQTFRAFQQKLSPTESTQKINLYLKTNDVGASVNAISLMGGHVGTVAGNILTVQLPLGAVPELANHPNSLRLEGSTKLRARLDNARKAMKVDEIHTGAMPLTQAYTGKGVVVGVIDFGLDFKHQAFRTAEGKSRVLSIWDQSATGTPPQGQTYGAECLQSTLDDNSCTHTSTNAHGTHVASIAAGSMIANSPYTGIAPESDIVFVSVGQTNTATCDGAKYIFDLAAKSGRPSVINMSLGSHSNPHDGTDLESQCLNNLAGPGKILVAAAGNEGQQKQHANPFDANQPPVEVWVHSQGNASGTPQRLSFLTGNESSGAPSQSVYLVVDDTTNLNITVGAVNANGVAGQLADVNVNNQDTSGEITVDGVQLGKVTASIAQTDGGSFAIQIAIEDTNGDKAEEQVKWFVDVTGTGQFDGYIDTTSGGGWVNENTQGIAVNNASSIGTPALAAKVLAVAAYTTRNEWTDVNGTMHQQKDQLTGQQVPLGGLALFSSLGPSRKEMLTGHVPDIAAPGELIAAALNSNAMEGAERILANSPNGWLLLEGTSMATPATVGAIALMLQRNPQLTVDDVRAIFKAQADKPEDGSQIPSYGWGLGKLNALNAVNAVQPMSAGGSAGSGGGTAGTGTAGTGTAGTGTAGSAGMSAAGSGTTAGSAGTGTAAPAKADDSGCSCQVAGTETSSRWGLSLLTMGMFVSLWRRRTQKQSSKKG
jgi:minor extracellular serine protease Vpr